MFRPDRAEIMLSARPLRVALVVDVDEATDAAISNFFSLCYRQWGGRYWIVIPSSGENIAESWFELLRCYDPDLLYCTFDASQEFVDRINSTIQPAQIESIENECLNAFDIDGVGVEWIPEAQWRQRPPLEQFAFGYFSTKLDPAKADAFVLQNFGVLDQTISSIHAFSAVPTEKVEIGASCAPDVIRLLRENKTGLVLPGALSRFQAPKPIETHFSQEHQGRHIVVGDSLLDRMYAWNRIHFDPWDRPMGTVWLPKAVLDANNPLFDEFLKYAKAKIFDQSNGGKNHVVSYSLTEDDLKPIAAALSKTSHHPYLVRVLSPNKFPKFEFAGDRANSQEVIQLDKKDRSAHVEMPTPKCLAGASVRGRWAVDIGLQDAATHADHIHPRPSLKVIRRLGIASSFFESPSFAGRVNRSNGISVFAATGMGRRQFRFPDERLYFLPLLNQVPHDGSQHRKSPFIRGPLSFFEPSDKGRSLYAIFRLFGGLTPTCQTMEEEVWRRIIMRASGEAEESRSSVEDRIAEIILRERTALGADASAEDILRAATPKLSDFFFSKKRGLAKPELSKAQMIDIFNLVKRTNVYPNGPYQASDRFDDVCMEDLDSLVSSGVFLQGSFLRCRRCGTKHWYPIDKLGATVTCEACASKFSVPPIPEWSFRLNGLLRRGVAQEGMMAMIQALSILARSARKGFVFLAAHTFYEYRTGDDPEKEFAEVDVLASVDSKLVLAEVKSRKSMLREEDFNKLERVAAILKPDVVLALAPKSQDANDQWPAWLAARFSKLRSDYVFIERAYSVEMGWGIANGLTFLTDYN